MLALIVKVIFPCSKVSRNHNRKWILLRQGQIYCAMYYFALAFDDCRGVNLKASLRSNEMSWVVPARWNHEAGSFENVSSEPVCGVSAHSPVAWYTSQCEHAGSNRSCGYEIAYLAVRFAKLPVSETKDYLRDSPTLSLTYCVSYLR